MLSLCLQLGLCPPASWGGTWGELPFSGWCTHWAKLWWLLRLWSHCSHTPPFTAFICPARSLPEHPYIHRALPLGISCCGSAFPLKQGWAHSSIVCPLPPGLGSWRVEASTGSSSEFITWVRQDCLKQAHRPLLTSMLYLSHSMSPVPSLCSPLQVLRY